MSAITSICQKTFRDSFQRGLMHESEHFSAWYETLESWILLTCQVEYGKKDCFSQIVDLVSADQE